MASGSTRTQRMSTAAPARMTGSLEGGQAGLLCAASVARVGTEKGTGYLPCWVVWPLDSGSKLCHLLVERPRGAPWSLFPHIHYSRQAPSTSVTSGSPGYAAGVR